jgi:hypothetical protein
MIVLVGPSRNKYVGTSKKDANFPSRLDLECPSCMMQAETIIDFFGQPGKEFFLFYHPRPPSAPLPLPPASLWRTLTTRKAKDSTQQEVQATPLPSPRQLLARVI